MSTFDLKPKANTNKFKFIYSYDLSLNRESIVRICNLELNLNLENKQNKIVANHLRTSFLHQPETIPTNWCCITAGMAW